MIVSPLVLWLCNLIIISLVSQSHCQQPQKIVIGRTISSFGGFAFDSAIVSKGIDIWIEDVKTRGGILMSNFDGLRHPIEVVTLEDASSTQIVDLQYRELV